MAWFGTNLFGKNINKIINSCGGDIESSMKGSSHNLHTFLKCFILTLNPACHNDSKWVNHWVTLANGVKSNLHVFDILKFWRTIQITYRIGNFYFIYLFISCNVCPLSSTCKLITVLCSYKGPWTFTPLFHLCLKALDNAINE